MKYDILFFGELPPVSNNGVSYSNYTNINILARKFSVFKIVENRSDTDLSANSTWKKVYRTAKDILNFSIHCLTKRSLALYLSFPSSISGATKILIIITIYKFICGGSIVLHIHRGDLYSFLTNNRWSNWLILKYLLFIKPYLIHLSELYIDSMRCIGFTRNFAIYNSVSAPDFYTISSESRFGMIFISNYLPGKGLRILLKSLALLQKKGFEIPLDCYGSGEKETYIKLSNALNLSKININAPILGESKYRAIANADILVLPSLNEGQPLIIIEAMAMGAIIVSSNVGVISEMFWDGYPFLVEPGDENSLATAITRAYLYPNKTELREKLILNYKSKFSPERHDTCMVASFDQILLKNR
jgi:glycosyltransferase involved in cell wall biosynthesis